MRTHPSFTSAASMRFEAPTREDEILARRENVIQAKTAQDTKYCINERGQWSNKRDKAQHRKTPPLSTITPAQFQFWLIHFVLKCRWFRVSSANTTPSLQWSHSVPPWTQNTWHLHTVLAEFRSTLETEMTRFQSKRIGSRKWQAEPLTEEEERFYRAKGFWGAPEALLNTIILMNWLYFAALNWLHPAREVRFKYSLESSFWSTQKMAARIVRGDWMTVTLVTKLFDTTKPILLHFSVSTAHQTRQNNCFASSFWRSPQGHWFSCEPLGHNTLNGTVSSMSGCWDTRITEQPIFASYQHHQTLRCRCWWTAHHGMGMHWHRSVEGVRSYKRTSAHQEEWVSDILNLAP